MRRSAPFALALSRAFALSLGLVLLARPARADDVELARKHFAEGVQRYRDGDFEGARSLFARANTEHHAPAIVYNVARAEERLAHPQAAVDAYDAYLAEAGESGEFTQAAVMAVARIRASSKLLRIESKPPGARLFIDGTMAREPAPTRVLVPAGRHHIVAEGDGWRAEADVEALAGAAPPETVTLSQPAPAPAPSTALPPPAGLVETPKPPPASPPRADISEGFVFGAEFAVVPHRFDETSTKPFTSFGLAAGFVVEAGYAPADNFVVLGRALLAVGSKGSPATTLGSIGVAFSWHATHSLWLGAAFQGGRALLPGIVNPLPGEERRFDTDYVFCPTLEASLVVIDKPYGQWLVSIFPGYYFASPTDNDLFFIPIGFGLRTY